VAEAESRRHFWHRHQIPYLKSVKMGETWKGPLEKIDNFRFRIPPTYKPGMRVPGIIYADEKLLKDIVHDKACEQVANVAFLPGIVKASLAMPDIHWGFGFPIGGVAATDIEEGGVISPGGVGYDINCLTAESRILHSLGYTVGISDLEKNWRTSRLSAMNFRKARKEEANIRAYIKIPPKEKLFEIKTVTGRKIKATADHPFWTQDGMAALKRLKTGSRVALYPFEGVPFEKPSDNVIIDEKDVINLLETLKKNLGGSGQRQILNYLKKRRVLPLRYDSPALPYLLKIAGFCIGDGNIHFVKGRGKGVTGFWGKKEDLEVLRKDVESAGFTCSRVYQRRRQHKINTPYDLVEFEALEESCKVVSSSFAILLVLLGCPFGNKTEQTFSVPQWLFKAPLWQKRLFLAAYFGAEMSSPKSFLEHGYNFYCPVVSMNKKGLLTDNAIAFFKDISALLSEFGVKTHKISENPSNFNQKGVFNYRIRLILSGELKDLINLYSKIGFEYNHHRSFLANAAIQFLKYKQRILQEREDKSLEAIKLHSEGLGPQEIYEKIGSESVNFRFIVRSIYEGRKTEARISFSALNFVEFLDESTAGLGMSGMTWDEIETIEEIPAQEYVYDFTVAHSDHNFIADNFVVSNCGIRMLRTSLQYEDIKDRVKELAHRLFSDVPAGVGSEGDIRVSASEEKKILVKGSKWAVENGFGCQEDLECTEEYGALAGADPEAVSERAYKRGKSQSGTLGSGNHFIEIQVIDQLYDSSLCDSLGLDLGQISIMIHSGSRGLGYQVCEDYTRSMIHCLDKYHINVPDRQLACAPVDSPEGKEYLAAMKCAANFAWANRQCLMHLTRLSFEKVLGQSWQKSGMSLVYDVCHNIAKIESYPVNGKMKKLCVHRKGATRAFGPGHPELPERYKATGQPVIIPGDMGRNSYLLAGTKQAEEETFGSCCHGAGRVKSRTEATRTTDVNKLLKELDAKGIVVLATGKGTIAEEAPLAYKNVNEVVDVVHNAGIAKRVCRMRPLGVIKG
jgi:tRNA-splicing ligase RtcB (3'-phosphate/5'-hydroxy nucleic acid ligase)